MPDKLSQEVQESNSSDAVESETLRILQESEMIKLKIQSDEIRKQYEEVRLATIAALKELRMSTSSDLQSFKNELTNTSSNLSE